VRGSLALERAARAWALLDGRSYVVPEDIERLFEPVLVHRVVFTPAFVARARATGWAEAIEAFRQSCLELAPQPGSEEDPLFDSSAGAEPASADSAPRESLKPGAAHRGRSEHRTTP
jgi:Mg-chelatase subunit ChlI